MIDPRQHAVEIAASMVGLPVHRAYRGVGVMMTLDLGGWSDELERTERSLWMSGAIWRLDVADQIVVDVVTSTDAEIDEALSRLTGKIVVDVALLEYGEIVVSGDDWSLIGFPVKREPDNWVLFDETGKTAFCGPNGELGSERNDLNNKGS